MKVKNPVLDPLGRITQCIVSRVNLGESLRRLVGRVLPNQLEIPLANHRVIGARGQT